MGYYHAIVDGGEKHRMDLLKEAGRSLDLPPMAGLERIWGAWDESGRTTGAEPLHWVEIEAYGRINGFTRDDMLTMRRMSEAYLEGLALKHPLAREPMDEMDESPYI